MHALLVLQIALAFAEMFVVSYLQFASLTQFLFLTPAVPRKINDNLPHVCVCACQRVCAPLSCCLLRGLLWGVSGSQLKTLML